MLKVNIIIIKGAGLLTLVERELNLFYN